MAGPKQAEALLNAATSGLVDKIRDLLADGAPVEATNVNRWTPVMCAAAHGHHEAYQVLVAAGANLHAVGFRQTDLLELAVESGNVEIVQDLLARGLPVNGHWELTAADNPVIRKMGHDVPLIRAASNGNVELVRILLDAGADRNAKHQGKTALDLAQDLLDDPDNEELHDAYREIVALLGGQPAKTSASADSIKAEIARFPTNAARPEYAQLHALLVKKCGVGRPWRPQPDHGLPATNAVAFTLQAVKRQKTLEELQSAAREAGCQLVLNEPWSPGEDAQLVLFPTADKLAVVAAVGTEGANHGIKTIPHVIDFLRTLDSEHPFDLFFCAHDAVGGVFVGSVKGAKKLAERIIRFCPGVLDAGMEEAETLANVLKKNKAFFLRWD